VMAGLRPGRADGRYRSQRRFNARSTVCQTCWLMGPIETAVRNNVSAGTVLSTPTGRGPFTVADIGTGVRFFF